MACHRANKTFSFYPLKLLRTVEVRYKQLAVQFGLTNTVCCTVYAFKSGLKQDGASSLFAFNCDLYSHYEICFSVLPSPLQKLPLMKIKYFISTLIYVFEYICITFTYTIVLLFNIYFCYKTLFTDTVSNIPLTVGVILSVFIGYDEQLQDLDIRLKCGQ